LGAKYLFVLCAGFTLLLVQSKALDKAPYKLSGAVVKLAGITFSSLAFSYWFDKPRLLTEGRLATVLIISSSWGSQLGGYLSASPLQAKLPALSEGGVWHIHGGQEAEALLRGALHHGGEHHSTLEDHRLQRYDRQSGQMGDRASSLIRCKRIYNFLCSMLVLHQLLYVLSILCGTFMIYLD
jgi:hypothetical protein